jgi:hypothetical protein
MYPILNWKQFAVFVSLLIISSCKKQRPVDPPNTPPAELPASIVYEPMLSSHSVFYCGSPLTSSLKISDGTDIGTVTVGNDGTYLYLTYEVTGDWFLGDVHCYAGQEFLIPRNADDGNPNHEQFPGQQDLDYCDQRQAFTFRVALSSLTSDHNGQCASNTQYYIAMRASVKQIASGADCTTGTDQAAWGAPFLINPGNTNEWATAFYYCKPDCNVTLPTEPWCGYSQGYWFNKADVTWCQNVKFGALEINQQDGVSLWPAQNNWIKRAFFQASALQLSMNCVNSSNPIPSSIVDDYNRLEAFLSTLNFANIQDQTFPSTTDTTGVQGGAGNIGRWICNNHCNSAVDSTACSGF